MNRKKICSIVTGVMLVTLVVAALPTQAESPRQVYGEVYIDNVLAPNGITVKLSFPGKTITNNTYANGNYVMYFMGTNYEEGTFSVKYLGVWYPTTPPTVELGDEYEIVDLERGK